MKKYVDIICILDRSGSMKSILNDAIGGYNTFLEEQQNEEGLARLTNILFSSDYMIKENNVDIKSVPQFTTETYVPSGFTALYDAIGKTIDDRIEWLSSVPKEERPEKTLCVILTDGEENSSRKYKKEQIKSKITEMREDFDWEFIFLAANQDATLAADSIGIAKSNSLNFSADSEGTRIAYANMSKATKSYRSSSKKTGLFDK